MKNVQVIKVILAIMITAAFIFSFSQFGARAYNNLFYPSDVFEANTKIASIDAAAMNKEELLNALENKKSEWEEKTEITVKYKEKTKKFDLDLFAFNLQDSVLETKSGAQNSVIVSLDGEELSSFLESLSSEIVKEDSFYLNKLNDSLVEIAAFLQTGEILIDADNYKVSKNEEQKVLSETTLAVADNAKSIKEWVKTFPSLEIAPHSTVSFLNLAEEAKEKNFSNLTLSEVATAVHTVVLATNFSVAERFLSNELPLFASLGYEARVNKDKKIDYRFYNPNDEIYNLTFKMIDQKLYVALIGDSFIYKYEVVLSDEKSFKPKTIIQFDPGLDFNESKTVTEGKNGSLIKVYRKIIDENGETIKKELMSEDFYAPVNKVIAHGLLEENSVSTEEEAKTDTNDETNINDKTSDASENNGSAKNDASTETDSNSAEESNDKEKKSSKKNIQENTEESETNGKAPVEK
ncbi:G5 domain-containing protein [Niallia sp. NCCP-28]|uniref:G5 domain-containing protein n=1 Tax=Niallia sp. NCCP-28 TaxID=2934712 RepID=UPI002083C5F4|nr:G5 domain-containing protein [Niallia sp. NCCP-28]GKU81449.1 hypothetical protein NCCP28_08450 [Niallia sp. NCCP-28]